MEKEEIENQIEELNKKKMDYLEVADKKNARKCQNKIYELSDTLELLDLRKINETLDYIKDNKLVKCEIGNIIIEQKNDIEDTLDGKYEHYQIFRKI